MTIEGVDAPYTVTFTTVTDDDVKFDIAPAQAIIATGRPDVTEPVESKGPWCSYHRGPLIHFHGAAFGRRRT